MKGLMDELETAKRKSALMRKTFADAAESRSTWYHSVTNTYGVQQMRKHTTITMVCFRMPRRNFRWRTASWRAQFHENIAIPTNCFSISRANIRLIFHILPATPPERSTRQASCLARHLAAVPSARCLHPSPQALKTFDK